ncbi:MAG TPA: inositol monophosphatase family protein [Alphaproteobacteria bacterium]|jgi:inositol-phosphate phosphatase/L-galactose 1-phosphate phosphatase/histidinol-phosphatase|nr:inositol monophosphatase family protein [Alphaproteobacteria bacterium]HRK98100.1 inositol monophosphatase family protein [Alphaproteobacteria bacterium]
MTTNIPNSFALRLADTAAQISLKYFGTPLDIISKQDDTPVTKADREIEQTLRDIIEQERPEDGILGEEFGIKETKNGLTWVIDPIDGTKSFTIARPTFGTLIGLCQNQTPVLGIIDQPILKHRWIGQTGHQSTFNEKLVSCRPCPNLKQAIFGTGSATQISDDDPTRFARIEQACRYTVFQGDCYFYGLMANGFIDTIVENHLGIYDFIALVPIIEGAGGKITDWSGNNKTLEGDPTLLACGDPTLHEKILKLI